MPGFVALEDVLAEDFTFSEVVEESDGEVDIYTSQSSMGLEIGYDRNGFVNSIGIKTGSDAVEVLQDGEEMDVEVFFAIILDKLDSDPRIAYRLTGYLEEVSL